MSLKCMIKTVYLQNECGAEDADLLLQWLLENPKGNVNLKQCSHLHTAVLQVLMACQPKISVAPLSSSLEQLLRAADLRIA